VLRTIGLTAFLFVLSVSATSAQQQPQPPQPSQNLKPLRPPNVPNARGTDSGPGPACDMLTAYGEVQPHGPPALPYGRGSPTPGPVPPMPFYGSPQPAPPNSNLGASGADLRNIVIPDAPKLNYRFVEPPQPPRGTARFANVTSVALRENGRLLAFQRLPMFQLMEYSDDGRLLRTISSNIAARPHGLRIDKSDNIWITDLQCNVIKKLNANGEVLMTIGTSGKAGNWDEAKGERVFNQPTDVAFAANGDIFVTTGHGVPNPRVVRFGKNGKFITSWGVVHADGSIPLLHTVVISPKNEVYVGDREAKIIRVFDIDGKPLREIQMTNLVCALFVDANNGLWMSTGQDGIIMRLDWNGKILGWIGQVGYGENDFGEAHFMTVSRDERFIYVGDNVNNDIKKLERVN